MPEVLAAVQTGDDRLDRVSRIIEAYDGQGIHRTGTDIDNASAAWLLDQVKRIGLDGGLEAFALDRSSPSSDLRLTLFRPKRRDRIHQRRTAGGEPARDPRHGQQDHRHPQQNRQILDAAGEQVEVHH